MLKKSLWALLATIATYGIALAAQDQKHDTDMQMHHHSDGGKVVDNRVLVHFPDQMRIHTLKSMRDHLLSLSEIQDALSNEEFDKAGEIAEQRLGMTSLKLHGAAESSKYMPEGMQAAGTEMHHAASRFAIAASDAHVSGDVKPALAALTKVTQACVACHSGYRLQ